MAVTDPVRPGGRPERRERPDAGRPPIRIRSLLRIGMGLVALGTLPATASAHGQLGHAGDAVAFWVVLVVPVVAGLLGGFAVLSHRPRKPTGGLQVVLGVVVLSLGAHLTLTAMATDIRLALGGGGVGIVAAGLFVPREHTAAASHHPHGDLAFGGLLGHRLVEGVIVGALYSTGAALGLLAAAAVVGHTVLETAALGGLYGADPRRGLAAVAVVQGGYLTGAGLGIGFGGTLPAAIHVVTLAGVGGTLLIVGAREMRGRARSTVPAAA